VTDALEKNRNQQCSSVCQAIVSGETEVGSVNIEQIKINCSQQGVDVTDALAPKPPDSGNGSSPPTGTPPADDPPTDDPPIDDPPADDPSTEKKGSNLPLIIGVSVLGGLILLTIIGLLMFVMMS
jgi:hypothetical protein